MESENKIFVKTNEELTSKIKTLEDNNLYLKTTNNFLVKTNKDFESKNKEYVNYIKELEKRPIYIYNKEPSIPSLYKPKPSIPSVSVKPFTHDGVRYYKSSDDILYDKAGDPQGLWDETTKTIMQITEDDVEDSDSDDEEEL